MLSPDGQVRVQNVNENQVTVPHVIQCLPVQGELYGFARGRFVQVETEQPNFVVKIPTLRILDVFRGFEVAGASLDFNLAQIYLWRDMRLVIRILTVQGEGLDQKMCRQAKV